jgi:hypothetical protein
MMLLWKIRYLDRTDKQFKDRDLHLDLSSLDTATRSVIELLLDDDSTKRNIQRFRHLFIEGNPLANKAHLNSFRGLSFITLRDYFEDEAGNELPQHELAPALSGNPNSVLIPPGAKQHDIDLILAGRPPIPVVGVTLNADQIRLLAYFSRDLKELWQSAFINDGPGSISGLDNLSDPNCRPALETAVTDDEIRSFVTIFRRLYLGNDPASFAKAVQVFVDVIGSHPFSKWVAASADDLARHLEELPSFFRMFQKGEFSFTSKRLIDVFLYTQYAHQPDERRERQFMQCLAAVHGKREFLTWVFLVELCECSEIIHRAGIVIADWFNQYCRRHSISPDILTSLREDHRGIGSVEKAESRRLRLVREKAERLAREIWVQNDRPEGGPEQFLELARSQLAEMMEP